MVPQFLLMYEIQGENSPKFHILFNELSKDAKLLELQEDPKVINVQLYETHKVLNK